jgi:importin subunit beta-1
VQNILNTNSIPLKSASFEALGYVCEEVPKNLQVFSNQILNAIATGMRKEETNAEIKLAATRALANSLDFAKDNFQSQNDRNLIMQMAFSVTQSEDEGIRTAAFSCLVEIAANYYSYLREYMNTIFSLTTTAINQDVQDVALQAIEFWCRVCDQELQIDLETEEAQEMGQPLDKVRQSHGIIKAALKSLLQVLLPCLTKQNENVDDDTWNVAQAASSALGLMAQTVKNDIIEPVLKFVYAHIQNTDWRYKEAAILSFGAILDGPDPEQLVPQVEKAFPILLTYIRDSNALVKDTAAWTVGRVCELLPDCTTPILKDLMIALVNALKDSSPKVASNACWAIHNLANAIAEEDANTNPLSPYFIGLIQALLVTTERNDSHESNLLSSAYEAVSVLISTAARDVYPEIAKILPLLLNKLLHTIKTNTNSAADREKTNEIQALLCSALQVIISKLDEGVIRQHANQIMGLLLQVLQSKHATVHEEALFAMGALANRVKESFENYITHLKPFLALGLQNAAEYKTCIVTVGLIGDIARALEQKFMLIGDDVMKILLEHLQNNNIERVIKPHIISCIGDIALAVGGHFERYMPYVMKLLLGAATLKITTQKADYDDIEYLVQLRESIFEAFTGILQGLSDGNKANVFIQTIPENQGLELIMKFIDSCAEDEYINQSENIIKASAGFIGDLASRIPREHVANYLRRKSVATIINQANKSQSDAVKQTGQWAEAMVKQVL